MPHDKYYTKPYTVIHDIGKIVYNSMTIYVCLISEKNDWLLGRQNIPESYIQLGDPQARAEAFPQNLHSWPCKKKTCTAMLADEVATSIWKLK